MLSKAITTIPIFAKRLGLKPIKPIPVIEIIDKRSIKINGAAINKAV